MDHNKHDVSPMMITLGTDIEYKFAWCMRQIDGIEMVCLYQRRNGMSTFGPDDFITAIPARNIAEFIGKTH